MSTPILATKLYTPPARPELVPRPRLIARLEESLGAGYKLTLISAPAGFGKTTVVTEWLRQGERDYSWLSLDESDNDPARFLIYLVTALQQLAPTIGQNLKQSAKLPPPETLVTILINDLTTFPDHFALVLDDYHLITNQLIHDTIELFLEHQPPHMHLVMTTREDPPLPLPRLRVRGQMSELRQDDLRFTSTEAAAFLNQTMHLDLTPESIEALAARTEGWIAGLQLAALSLRSYGPGQAAHFIEAFSGSHRYVIDYLVEEVVAQQPDHIRDFLRHTAVLDRLTAPLCDALTGGENSRTILTQLEHANLFLIPLDEHREWYRYHHLFSEFLRTENEPEHNAALHQAAAQWFEENDLVTEAIKHALAGANVDHARRLIGQTAMAQLVKGELATLLGWIEALPDAVVRADFDLSLYKGWAAWMIGHGDMAAAYAQAAGELSAQATPLARHRLDGLRACIALAQGDAGQTIELATNAVTNLPPDDHFFRPMSLIILAEGQSVIGDTAGAVQTLRQATQSNHQTDDHFLMIGLKSNLADQLHNQGKRREAMALCRQMIEQYVDARGEPWPMTGMAYLQLGIMAYDGNDLALAQSCLDKGLALTENIDLMGPAMGGKLAQAFIKSARGETEAAVKILREARQQVSGALFAGYMPILNALEAFFYLKNRDIAAAERWGAEANLSITDTFPAFFEIIYLIYAELLLRQSQPDPEAALTLLQRIETATKAGGRGRLLIHTSLLQALAYQVLNDEAKALAAMEQALRWAEPEGFRRLFIETGSEVAPLLIKCRAVAPAFVDQLLADFAQEDLTPSPNQQSLIEPLSSRELELLALVAEGRSNSDIAETLFITIGTVKKHLNNIFGKLAVRNRTEAVARARDLGLVN
ncbi:MAG: LuxR C-terminal-related transcriptional regulator [Anaerolineae bacterium]|nr:LuxR C-terminal-related transcriptional regulator [Anaerolineae bacterium]